MSSTFTITQTPTSANLFLYPNADVINDMTTSAGVNHYACVDETYDVPDDDTTYVYSTAISIVTDLYGLPNHTAETGTINNVKVISRVKSHLYTQSSSGIYKLLVSTSAATYYSSDFDITTDYASYNWTMTSCPSSSAAWTWADVDNLKIGVTSSSPTTTGYAYSTTFRPNSNYNVEMSKYFDSSNYLCVDDSIGNDFTDYVANGATNTTKRDLYEIPNHTTETGVIDYVEVFIRANYIWNNSSHSHAYAMIKTGGTEYSSTEWNLTENTWIDISYKWTSNPSTAAAWTWANIDDLKIGVKLKNPSTGDGAAYCTQVYAVVAYHMNVNPQIRTTQCYAIVNYTPSSSSCYLNKPVDYSYELGYEIQKHNWWNNTRTTRMLYRTNKTVTLEGIEFDTTTSTATTRLTCVEMMKDNGTYVTISGLDDTNLNTTWIIKDFNYDISPDNPNVWVWNMTLEKK